MSHKESQDPKLIGARFRSARTLVPKLNRKSFCERHGINRYTMQSWENGLHISKGKNVERFIEALALEGISCSSEWLFEGKGEPAKPFDQKIEPSLRKEAAPLNHAEGYANVFLRGADPEEMVSVTLSDDAMAPKFLTGDVVIGIKHEGDISELHQKFCLVALKEDRLVCRKVIYLKDHVIMIALDEREPSFQLKKTTPLYEVICHLLC